MGWGGWEYGLKCSWFIIQCCVNSVIQQSVSVICVCVCAQLLQSGPTLCDPMDCRWPGSSAHGIFPGKNTGVGGHALHHGIFPPRDRTLVSSIAGRFFTAEVLWKPEKYTHTHTHTHTYIYIHTRVCVFHILFPYFLYLLQYNCFAMLCWFLLYNNVNQPYVHLSPPFWASHPPLPHSTFLEYHKLLSWAPCAIACAVTC